MYYIRFVYTKNIYKTHSLNNTFSLSKIIKNKGWKKYCKKKN